jgi:hypothetical protein
VTSYFVGNKVLKKYLDLTTCSENEGYRIPDMNEKSYDKQPKRRPEEEK